MPFCDSKQVKKNGTRDGKQRYKCTARNKRFSGGSRLDPDNPSGSFTVTAGRPPHSLQSSMDAA
ncbi:transposase-like zinc-binding domain-containing protein, partial [Cardiobacterium valvarum]|uniref:transposase-like zinc-binding domain-containing protein n=1 Tax=Cardiobacterium valvarum TaxID=194702 RepID=UPI001C11AAB3